MKESNSPAASPSMATFWLNTLSLSSSLGWSVKYSRAVQCNSPRLAQTIYLIYSLLFVPMLLSKCIGPGPVTTTGSRMFKNVCLGGTFDGIHAGHKLLFKEATKMCSERLVVGVTDTTMLKNKTLWELIAPIEDRIQGVKQYLQTINPNLTYQVVTLYDLYGPTIVDKDLECIVASDETVRGANKINQARKEKGWPELVVHLINLLEEDHDATIGELMHRLNERKISSSLMRIQKLGKLLKKPKPNPSIPKIPYIIGLTGGIASGKTAIGKYLETLGFGYINYDLLGHKTYAEIGSPVYNEILEFFGESVLNESTRHIDRPKLGKEVFADKTKLDKLNSIVWPAIYALVDQEIERLRVDHDKIVLESALLLESGQESRVHQVWTTIIPPDEAVKRQMNFRGLDRGEAERRVKAQIDNYDRVQRSNVVFCSLWEPEFTQKQVRIAVDELKEFLHTVDGPR